MNLSCVSQPLPFHRNAQQPPVPVSPTLCRSSSASDKSPGSTLKWSFFPLQLSLGPLPYPHTLLSSSTSLSFRSFLTSVFPKCFVYLSYDSQHFGSDSSNFNVFFSLLIFPIATVCNRPPTESHISSDQLCSRTLAGLARIHAVCEESWSLGFINTGAHEKWLSHTVDKHAHKFTDKPRSSKSPWSRAWARNQIAWAHDSTLHSSALSCTLGIISTYSIGWLWGLNVERIQYKYQ